MTPLGLFLSPRGLFLRTSIRTVYNAYSGCLPTRLNPLAERACCSLVLTTHHHWDHAGGNDEMKGLVPGVRVVGSAIDGVEGCTDPCDDGDTVEIGTLSVKVRQAPSWPRSWANFSLF